MLEKKTKIVCTIGPSSWDPKLMKTLIEKGMNVARVNGAFADPDELDRVAKLVRDVGDKVALMVDVKGPEVRMNKFASPIPIEPGSEIVIGSTTEDHIYPANYLDVYKYLKPGQRIIIGDGDVELVVTKIENGKIYSTVVYGELFKPGKAMNLPGAEYASSSLTDKDIENLKHAIATGWDFVSASFIQDAQSAREVKEMIGDSPMKLIAKIEDQKGVDNIDEILEVVDGIMIARGGLGVELGLEKVPTVQRLLIRKANEAGKPVITATQMLESMTYNPRPTRAEVNDVALAVYLGSDAVMLSGESSAGKYPVESVEMLTKICIEMESQREARIIREYSAQDVSATDAITKAAAELCISMENEVDCVLVVSRSGRTARLLGRHNLKQSIYCFTSSMDNVRTLMLSKGIVDINKLNGTATDRDDGIELVVKQAIELGIIQPENRILVLGRSRTSEEFFPNVFEIIYAEDYQ